MKVKRAIENKKLEHAKLQGQQEALRKKLKDEFGVETKDEAEKLITKKKLELEKITLEYREKEKEFSEKFGEFL